MNAIRFTLAAAAFGVSGLAFAAGAYEGGTASDGLTFEPAVTGAVRARADVAAEGRAAVRAINSRSGQQSNVEANNSLRVVSTRDRAEVRAEALAAVRGPQAVFEGGESASVRAERLDRVQPAATLASMRAVQLN